MRPLLFTVCVIFFAIACRKELHNGNDSSLLRIQLTDSMQQAVLNDLDFNQTVFTKEGETRFARVPFHSRKMDDEFVLVRLDEQGRIILGRIIRINLINRNLLANGDITVKYLNGNNLLENAAIINGCIQWHAGDIHLRDMLVPGADGKVLPEVIVVATCKKPNASINYYYSLAGLMGGGSSGNSAYYSSASATGGGGGTSSSGGTGKSSPAGKSDSKIDNPKGAADVILVDFESVQQNTAISLDQYIKCFNSVPDNGATCSITIFADIPVDGQPEQFFDWKNGSPGHSFLQLQKTNGGSSVIQFIGFYPQSGWKTLLTPAPVNGKFVDNGGHEFNASLKMNLSALQLQNILNEISRHKLYQYDIDEYNCTDFALEIFNYQRPNKLVIPKYDLPGGQAPYGSSTPQGLYLQLKGMKSGGGVEATNITVPGVKGYVAYSKGPCN